MNADRRLYLENTGLGPAIIKSVVVTVEGELQSRFAIRPCSTKVGS